MKRYLSYIVFVVLSIAVIGCTKTETDSISSEVGQLTLQFSNRALTTRAAGAADDDHNEDLIKSVIKSVGMRVKSKEITEFIMNGYRLIEK